MPQICGDAKKSKTYGCVLLVFYWKHAKATLKKQRADTLGCWVCVKLLQPAKKRPSSNRFTQANQRTVRQ